MNKNILDAYHEAEWTEPGLGEIIVLLHEMQYLPDNPPMLQFSSGGGFEHLVIQNKEGYWLLLGNMHGISISNKQFVDSNAAYEAFWNDEGKAFSETQIAVEYPSEVKRPPLDVVKEILNNNWFKD